MPLILLKSKLFICKLEKGAVAGLSIANLDFSEIAFCVEYLHKVGSLKLSSQSADELVCFRSMEILVICNSRNSNLLFQIQVLRSWG
jgi:hypothetical protein